MITHEIQLDTGEKYTLKVPQCVAEGTLGLRDKVILYLLGKTEDLTPKENYLSLIEKTKNRELAEAKSMWFEGRRVGAILKVSKIIDLSQSDATDYCEQNFTNQS